MKKILVMAGISVFISLGFNVVNNTRENISSSHPDKMEKLDFSDILDEKRLASWD